MSISEINYFYSLPQLTPRVPFRRVLTFNDNAIIVKLSLLKYMVEKLRTSNAIVKSYKIDSLIHTCASLHLFLMTVHDLFQIILQSMYPLHKLYA